jgi:hypothetical protein
LYADVFSVPSTISKLLPWGHGKINVLPYENVGIIAKRRMFLFVNKIYAVI